MIEVSAYSGFQLPADVVFQQRTSHAFAMGAGVLAIAAALWFGGQGQLLRIALPAMATAVGLVLFLQRPIAFVQYAAWVWFLTPLIRRLVDWRFGFVDPNLVMLMPFLVSGVTAATLLPSRKVGWVRPPASFVLCSCGIMYGFVVGMLVHPSAETVFGLLNWLSPLLLGFYLYVNWPLYEQLRSTIGRTFVWAVLILGVYGVYQFFAPPAWDIYWLDNVWSTSTSFGYPEPMQVRIWSTLNSPGPFADVMMVGLLLLFVVRSRIKLLGGAAGYLSFLLSVVRTAWLSWVVGLVLLLGGIKPRVFIRTVLTITVLMLILVPIVQDPRVAPLMGDRVKTFTDLKNDESFGARWDMYQLLVQDAIRNPFGSGLSNLKTSHGIAVDSGLLAAMFSLGWLGSGLLAVGVFALFANGIPAVQKSDEFLSASKAIILAILAQIVSGNIFVGVTGAMFWMFAGMYLGGLRYHENEAFESMQPLESAAGARELA